MSKNIHVVYGLIFFGILLLHAVMGYISLFGIYKNKKVNSDFLIKLKFVHKVKKLKNKKLINLLNKVSWNVPHIHLIYFNNNRIYNLLQQLCVKINKIK